MVCPFSFDSGCRQANDRRPATLLQSCKYQSHVQATSLSSPGCVCCHRVRLVMLFALRYERDGRSEISSLIQRCQDFGMSLSQLGIVRTILLQAGADKCASAAGSLVAQAGAIRWRLRIHSIAQQAERGMNTGNCGGLLQPLCMKFAWEWRQQRLCKCCANVPLLLCDAGGLAICSATGPSPVSWPAWPARHVRTSRGSKTCTRSTPPC